MTEQYRRRVGTVRPSHLMFTGGVGAIIDLPNFAAMVGGIDDWRYDQIPEWGPIAEPRLLAAVRNAVGGPEVKELRPSPWMPSADNDPNDPSLRIGVPVQPFPQWLRCTRCDTLAGIDSGIFGFENSKARRPDEARFVHTNCGRRNRFAVTTRFLVACINGHLDEFPYVTYVHKGTGCPKVSHPTLKMKDFAGNLGANVNIECTNCGAQRNIREALGRRGEENLPRCRARHPHLGIFEQDGCDVGTKLLVVGASNQWFGSTLSALSVPRTGASALAAMVEQLWPSLEPVTSPDVLKFALMQPTFAPLGKWKPEEIWAAMQAHRSAPPASAHAALTQTDLLTPEWEAFTNRPLPDATTDFTLREAEAIPRQWDWLFSEVVHAERLREVRALTGFTRLDAPDPDDPDLVVRVGLSRDAVPSWVPASEVRGEGLFLRIRPDLVDAWTARLRGTPEEEAHAAAYREFRKNRYSERITATFDPMRGWPGVRYYLLHTLSHMMIRAIALECGYSAASLTERIYAGDADQARQGILIYTAVPDAEGTLGGLVALGEPHALDRILRRALADAVNCSSDPLCAERAPGPGDDFLHAAVCHVCGFVSETTCERGNRFLDRRFVVPVGRPELALISSGRLP